MAKIVGSRQRCQGRERSSRDEKSCHRRSVLGCIVGADPRDGDIVAYKDAEPTIKSSMISSDNVDVA
jgi:hypothetical protein